jgi:hypothetical protein
MSPEWYYRNSDEYAVRMFQTISPSTPTDNRSLSRVKKLRILNSQLRSMRQGHAALDELQPMKQNH